MLDWDFIPKDQCSSPVLFKDRDAANTIVSDVLDSRQTFDVVLLSDLR